MNIGVHHGFYMNLRYTKQRIPTRLAQTARGYTWPVWSLQSCGNRKAVSKSCGKPENTQKTIKSGGNSQNRKAAENIKFYTESQKQTPQTPPPPSLTLLFDQLGHRMTIEWDMWPFRTMHQSDLCLLGWNHKLMWTKNSDFYLWIADRTLEWT